MGDDDRASEWMVKWGKVLEMTENWVKRLRNRVWQGRNSTRRGRNWRVQKGKKCRVEKVGAGHQTWFPQCFARFSVISDAFSHSTVHSVVPLSSPAISSNSFPFRFHPSHSPSLWRTSASSPRLSNDCRLFILLSPFASSLLLIAFASLSLPCSPSPCLDCLTCISIHYPALFPPLLHFRFVDLTLDHIVWCSPILVGSFSHNCSSLDLGSWLHRVSLSLS